MGEILTFKPRANAPARSQGIGPEGAEILFFLGVRYENYIEPRASGEKKPGKPPRAGKPNGRGKRRA